MYQTVIDIEATFDLMNKRLNKLEEKIESMTNILRIQGDKIYALECTVCELENIYNNNVNGGDNSERRP